MPSLPAPPYACEVHEEQPDKLDLTALEDVALLLVAAMIARHLISVPWRKPGVMLGLSGLY